MKPSDSRFALINVPITEIYTENPETDDAGVPEDEALYGYICRILDSGSGFSRILTHYGIAGYIRSEAFIELTAAEVLAYLKGKIKITDISSLDVLAGPHPAAKRLITLSRGSLLRSLETDTVILPEGRFALEDIIRDNAGSSNDLPADACSAPQPLSPEGWTKVLLADSSEGYVPSHTLAQKYFDEVYLFEDTENIPGIGDAHSSFSFQAHLNHHFVGMELIFRQYLLEEAMKYTGTQFRAGGRSAWGIDSMGLVFMAYLRAGITIGRRPVPVNGFPLEEIAFERDEDGLFALSNLDDPEYIRPGDILYFRHDQNRSAALYIGGGHYIHSSDTPEQFGVVMNSLDKKAPDYREDLHRGLYAVYGIRI